MARSATIVRRGKAGATLPPVTTGLVMFLDARQIAGATNGAVVSSWPDMSGNGNHATGSGASRPTYVTGADPQAQPIIRFAGSHQLSVSTLSAAVASRYYVIVGSAPSSTGNHSWLGAANAGNSGGLQLRSSSLKPLLLKQAQAGIGTDPTSNSVIAQRTTGATENWPQWHVVAGGFTQSTGAFLTGVDGYEYSGTQVQTLTASTVVIGTNPNNAIEFLTSDIQAILAYDRIPTLSERNTLLAWAQTRYTKPAWGPNGWYSAAANITQPSYDSTGTVIEQSIKDFGASGWNGKRYWMAYVPWGGTATANENPGILVSTDKNTWTVPTGGTNPLVAKPASGNNSDPDLFYNAADGKLYLAYLRENTSPTSDGGTYQMSSSDGVTWSTPTQTIPWSANNEWAEPQVHWDGSQYVMIALGGASGGIYRWTSTTPTGPWTGRTHIDLSFTKPNATTFHWGRFTPAGGKYVAAIADGGDRSVTGALPQFVYMSLWLISTTDFQTFTLAPRAILQPNTRSAVAWDRISLYTGTPLANDDGTTMDIIYTGSGVTNGSAYYLGRATGIPLSEIP